MSLHNIIELQKECSALSRLAKGKPILLNLIRDIEKDIEIQLKSNAFFAEYFSDKEKWDDTDISLSPFLKNLRVIAKEREEEFEDFCIHAGMVSKEVEDNKLFKVARIGTLRNDNFYFSHHFYVPHILKALSYKENRDDFLCGKSVSGYIDYDRSFSFNKAQFEANNSSMLIDCLSNYEHYMSHPKIGEKILSRELKGSLDLMLGQNKLFFKDLKEGLVYTLVEAK